MTVPLSEREQKILDEIEKSLSDEDPRFAEDRRARRPINRGGSRVRLGVLTFIIGLGLLIVFFLTRVLFAGLLAFGGMVAGIVLLASPMSALIHASSTDAGRKRESIKRSVSDWDDTLRKRFRRR